jgi:ferredoxin-NADP reductase
VRIIFDHAEVVKPGINTFYFRPEGRLRYEPGQFIELYLPHTDFDERGERREFSLSSSPHEPLIAITTNFDFENGSTFKRELRKLKPGEAVAVNEPMGDFVLPKDTSIPLVFVAAGIGSAPYASIVKSLLASDERRTIQLIYSVSRPDDFLFMDEWQAYGLDFVPIVTRPDAAWAGLTGRLDAARIIELAGPLPQKLTYLAGPQSMIEPIFNDLLATGLTRSQVLLDYFSGY